MRASGVAKGPQRNQNRHEAALRGKALLGLLPPALDVRRALNRRYLLRNVKVKAQIEKPLRKEIVE